MQKGRILLSVSLLPIVIYFLVHLLLKEGQAKHTSIIQSSAATIPTIQETQILQPTETPTPSPTITPKPSTPTPQPTKTETLQKALSPTDYILQKVNEYRKSLGLSNVSTNSETCNFAKIRAEEISSVEKFNHDGFTKRINEKSLPYPSYSEVTENIAYNTDFSDVVNRWIESPGHAENMRKNTSYVCIGKYGDYYTYEGWQP